jgi:hypothetical protein
LHKNLSVLPFAKATAQIKVASQPAIVIPKKILNINIDLLLGLLNDLAIIVGRKKINKINIKNAVIARKESKLSVGVMIFVVFYFAA